MLKRSVVLVLAVLYLVTVSGFALNLHYCFNRLSSVKIDAPANACVKVVESSSNKMKCCKDSHINIKVKDAHQGGSSSFWGKFYPVGLPLAVLTDLSFKLRSPSLLTLSYRGPPPLWTGTPIFLRNCTFRI